PAFCSRAASAFRDSTKASSGSWWRRSISASTSISALSSAIFRYLGPPRRLLPALEPPRQRVHQPAHHEAGPFLEHRDVAVGLAAPGANEIRHAAQDQDGNAVRVRNPRDRARLPVRGHGAVGRAEVLYVPDLDVAVRGEQQPLADTLDRSGP